MLQHERLNQIMDYLKKNKSAGYRRLADVLHVSQATVRRDTELLISQGMAEKTYGGVILFGESINQLPINVRVDENVEAKNIIAEKASKLIRDDMSLFICGSSTTYALIPYLRQFRNLHILTNSIELCERLSGLDIYCTGGRLRSTDNTFIGTQAEKAISAFHAQLCFFSPTSLSMEGDILIFRASSVGIISQMMKNSEKNYVLCDSSKFGGQSFFRICGAENVTGILSNQPLPESIQNKIKK